MRLMRPRIQPHDRIAEGARRVFKRGEQGPREPARSAGRRDVHALDLADAVIEAFDRSDTDRLAVQEPDQAPPAGWAEVRRRR